MDIHIKKHWDKLFARGITVYGTYRSGSIIATANLTSIEFPQQPQPVPEFSSLLVLTSLLVSIFIASMIYGRRNKHNLQ
jgi:hypothetical protein